MGSDSTNTTSCQRRLFFILPVLAIFGLVALTGYSSSHLIVSSTTVCSCDSNPRKPTYGPTINGDSLTLAKLAELSENLQEISRQQNGKLDSRSKQLLQGAQLTLDEILHPLRKDGLSKTKNTTISKRDNEDVCQEHFAFKRLNGGFPFFYKGFEIENCTGKPEFHTLLTLVYNFVFYNADDLSRVPRIIKEINKVYPGVEVIAAVPASYDVKTSIFKNVEFHRFNTSGGEMVIWNKIISKVKTKYVYIGRDVVHFTWFDRLERLVREINNLGASVVAGAFRAFKSGKWSNGCEQSLLRNYSLAYTAGYHKSTEECMMCHHVQGPFVAKTELLKTNPLPEMGVTSSFAIWYLSIKGSGKRVYSCPDAMAFVRDDRLRLSEKSDWKDLALKLQVERIQPSPGRMIKFSCSEANSNCGATSKPGIALSHCCTEELVDNVKLILTQCKEKGMLCELQEGTLLGALKFGGSLPWEVDADVTLHAKNFTSFATLIFPYFRKLGFKCNTGRGFHHIFTKKSRWMLEIFSQERMDTETLSNDGISPTLVNFDGLYLPSPESPGLFVRNRYGDEIYQHVQHWRQNGKKSSWDLYGEKKFKPCPKPGHHACLDQYKPDGNIGFRDDL